MKAALAQGAKCVVWVTLRETRGVYHPANIGDPQRRQALAAAARGRLEQLQRGQAVVPRRRPAPDADRRGRALAGFLRGYVLQGSKSA